MKHLAGYDWDVFISYKRGGNSPDFARVLRDGLRRGLADQFPNPRVFFDDLSAEAGAHPEHLMHTVRSSALVLAVWVPAYEMSDWCAAEWFLARARERLCPGAPSLVYPVRWEVSSNDIEGGRLPGPAGVRGDTSLVPSIAEFSKQTKQIRFPTVATPAFCAATSDLARDLAGRLNHVPAWDPDFSLVTATPPPFTFPAFFRKVA